MKKFISVIFILCLCLSLSTSFIFAAVSDSQASSIVSDLSTVKTTLNNIYSRLGTIQGYLYQNGHSIAYWVEAIDTWMQPIYGRLVDLIQQGVTQDIAGLLASTETVDGTTVRTPYLFYNGKSTANWLSDIYSIANSYFNTTFGVSSLSVYNGYASLSNATVNGTQNLLGAFFNNFTRFANGHINYSFNGFNSLQTATNWGSLSSSTFTPISSTDGIYKWLSAIQTPVARLSYVLASDERIEAQQAASLNEQAVVDNFIDSSGSGAASTSDFGSVSDLSSGFKNNISTDASVSGIWNIFNSDNFGWFSQETADQLDTTGSGNRTLRSSSNYPTPLLDQQTEDILKYIGGDDND